MTSENALAFHLDRSDLLRRLAETDGGIEAPVARADRLKPGRGRSPAQRRKSTFELPLAHADHVKSSGPPDPRDPDAIRREQTLLEPLRARKGALARADEVKRPRRDLRARTRVQGFKSRDFH
jgi:hypothetical protein